MTKILRDERKRKNIKKDMENVCIPLNITCELLLHSRRFFGTLTNI